MNERSALAAVCWAGAAAVAVRGADGSVRVAQSLRWLRRRPTALAAGERRRQLLLIVPVLREQRLVRETTRYLLELADRWGPATVVLASTGRELSDREKARQRLPQLAASLRRRRTPAWLAARFAGLLPADQLHHLAAESGQSGMDYLAGVSAAFDAVPTTPELAEAIAAGDGRVVHHHVPDPGAAMVHQINAAVAAELRRLGGEGAKPDEVWIAVYNADSRPHPQTVEALAMVEAGARVVQQSALFTIGQGRAGVGGAVCDGAALLQTRWTLAREIPRLRAQARGARASRRTRPRLGHCVGHGLFVRGDLWNELGGLPATTMNEDLAFGYLLSAAGIPIDPLPVAEHAEAPETLHAVLRQARQWFWSYPQYPAAAALASDAGLGTPFVRTWLTVHGLARGALWLGQSPAVAATLLLPLVARQRWVAAAAAATAMAAYTAVPVTLLAFLQRGTSHPVRCRPRELAGTVAAATISSVGPWWCLWDLARAALSGHRPAHDKTER